MNQDTRDRRRPKPYKRSDGNRLNEARVGDRVRVTLVGQLIDYDEDLGHWTLRGSSVEGHVTWEYTLHWGTAFDCVCGKPVAHLRADEDSAEWACLVPAVSS